MPTQRSSHSELLSSDLALLHLLAEQQAIPTDQLARLLGSTCSKLRPQVKRLERAGWLATVSFSIDKYSWLRTTSKSAGLLKYGYLRRPPSVASLNHRRGVIEARLQLREERPNGCWVSEGMICRGVRPMQVPDGVLEQAGERWAIEVELSRKDVSRVKHRLNGLLETYDRVIYFCPDHVVSCIDTARSAFPAHRVELRRVRTASWLTPPRRCHLHKKRVVTPREAELLRLVCEEGAIATDQLSRLVGCELKRLGRELGILVEHGFLAKGFGRPGSYAWVWCTYRGLAASGSGFGQLTVTSSARLPRRRALMSVRLALAADRPRGHWRTRRVLAKGTSRGIPAEMSVFEQGGRRAAVMALSEAPTRPDSVQRTIDRLAHEYDVVWWYCAAASQPEAKRLVSKVGWQNVEIRDLPPQ